MFTYLLVISALRL